MKAEMHKMILKYKIIVAKVILCILVILVPTLVNSQGVAINTTGAICDNSAMLDITSSTQGIIIPRLTNVERNSIPAPAIGLIIFNVTTNSYNYYKATGWYELGFTFQSSIVGVNSPGGIVAINETGNPANASAILDVSSTTGGVLIPRTTEASLTAVEGLIYFDTALNRIRYYDGTAWRSICETFITATIGGGSLLSVGVAINDTGNSSDPSALLDIESNTKGLLIPRMTTLERGLMLPVTGLTIYNLTTNTFDYYNGIDWYKLEHSAPAITMQPSNSSICIGGSFNPQVTATGGTLTYQWQFSADGISGWVNVINGTPVNSIYANATSATGFTISGNIPAGTYYYHCIVSNGCGSITSNNGVLTVVGGPPVATITASCNPGDISNGTYCCYPATLFLYGNAPGATSWSWTGPNSFSSTLQNPTVAANNNASEGFYYLIATNACGASPQASRYVTVEVRPNSNCD